MNEGTRNPQLIAQNTAFLFLRMLFVMGISFFTTRLVLDLLGVENFGIYSVVGGVTAIFSILTIPIVSTIQRYFNVEISIESQENNSVIFNSAVALIIIVSVVVLVLYETVGLYCIKNVIKIPEAKLDTAIIVYQISIIADLFYLFSIPYQALVFAKERMGIIAFIQIGQSVFKLLLILLLGGMYVNVLLVYSTILLLSNVFLFLVIYIYCKKHYDFVKINRKYDLSLMKRMGAFTSWSLFDSISGISIAYGSNIVINIFGGISYNTAFGISKQVSTALQSFSANYMKAAEPQITTSYFSDDINYRNKLVCYSAAFAFYLLWLVSLVFLFEADYIMTLWLRNPPEHSILFCRLFVVDTLIQSVSSPLTTIVMASGNIKYYQLLTGGVRLLNLPISYLLLKFGSPIYSVFIVFIIISALCLVIRIVLLYKLIHFPVLFFLKNVIFRIIAVVVISLIVPWVITFSFGVGFFRLFSTLLFSTTGSLLCVYFLGFSKEERMMFMKYIKKLYIKKLK